ncbi:MAG: GTPase HflX [Candidatus Bathyarchaeota archaeon]|nr:GTPase HflX [Candidatus Bathyarchaeota archaeon]MDH5494784.1 GTPase HflX [Candidatus Bathyarchaeota archaeon]
MQRRLRNEPSSLKELGSLAGAAGYTVVAAVEQVRKADPGFQIGRGKVEEITRLVKKYDAGKIIFDNKLKSVQAYNLAKETGIEAIDRFQIILEIFTRRASTKEAKLQIQLAKLRYELAHAKEKVRLARMEEQPGFMGLGAYEVDVYHRAVQRQVHTIQEKLRKIKGKRGLHRKRRRELGFSSVSLAGYTYAGKSTLFNALVQEAVPTSEKLFTTLSTTTRIVELFGKRVLLTDTVGFIDRLPLTLIEAFRSTLEETIFSDSILLIVDGSEPLEDIERKVSVSLDIIQRIGAHGIPIVTVLNKIDLLSEFEIQKRTEVLKAAASNVVPISALHSINISLLKQELSKRLKNYVHVTFSIPLSDETLSFLSWLFNYADVRNVKYENNYAKVVFEAVSSFVDKVLGRVEQYGGTVKELVELE